MNLLTEFESRTDRDAGLNAWRSEPTMSGIKRRNDSDEGDVAWVEDLATIGKMRKKDLAESLTKSPEESPRQNYDEDRVLFHSFPYYSFIRLPFLMLILRTKVHCWPLV